MMRRHGVRLSLVVAMIGVLGLLGAGPALAHDALIDSYPADGATLDVAPTSVTLRFNDAVQNLTPLITVVDPVGDRWEGSPVTVLNNTVSVPVNPLGAAGTYTVAYRVVSADGHAVAGATTFDLTTAGSGSANVAPTGDAGGATDSIPAWVWMLGAGLVVALVIVVGVVTTRRRTADQVE